MSEQEWQEWAAQLDTKLAVVGEGDRVIIWVKDWYPPDGAGQHPIVEELERIGLADRSFVLVGEDAQVHVIRGGT
jgi:hypothetical protein